MARAAWTFSSLPCTRRLTFRAMALKSFLSLLPSRSGRDAAPGPDGRDHPYLGDRYRFERLFGDLVRSRYTWQFTALITMAVNLVLAIGLVVVASQHKVVPFIVEVDELGQAHAIGQLQTAAARNAPCRRRLLRFISDMRTVPRDLHLLNAQLVRAQAHVAGSAAATFRDQMRADNEEITRMMRQERARYVTAITHVLLLPDEDATYRVAWQELLVDGRGGEERRGYEGHFRMQMLPPPGDDGLLHNPMGIYVVSYALAAAAPPEPE